MKIYLVIFIVTVLTSSTSGMRCWRCLNARSQLDCRNNGEIQECSPTENACQTEVRYSNFKDPMITTKCKESHACYNNEIQNPRRAWLPTQCNRNRMNSVCRCCCSGELCNQDNIFCEPKTTDIQPQSLTTVRDAEQEEETECKSLPKKPFNGKIDCNNGKSLESRCKFICNNGYERIGAPSAVCSFIKNRPMWNRRTPKCRKIIEKCGRVNAPENGDVDCKSEENDVGTECNFQCNDWRLVGSKTTKCVKDIGERPKWSEETPTCTTETVPPCRDLGNLKSGSISCDNDLNEVGTECSFQCLLGHELQPNNRTSIECVVQDGKSRWSKRKPCCNEQCPPLAHKDIVIMIDSSKSVTGEEWGIMKDFVINVTSRFEISKQFIQIAAFRFNRYVDTASQILFGDYNDKEELTDAIRNIPKDGGGTNIGKALRYANDVVLAHESNRPEVADMIWVVTDGKSKDKVTEEARKLRAKGVEIIALGIDKEGEGEQLKAQLTDITGDADLVMQVDDVIDGLVDDFVFKVADKICEVSCDS